jgi:hypothetical protein
MITNSILSDKQVKALKAYHRGSNWHICDAQRMAQGVKRTHIKLSSSLEIGLFSTQNASKEINNSDP